MRKARCYTTVVVVALLFAGIHSTLAGVTIPGNTQYGTWDPNSRVYTLTGDANEAIWIGEGNLTLEGAGHAIILDENNPEPVGIRINSLTAVTVRNVAVAGFTTGVLLDNCRFNTVTGSNVSNCAGTGIELFLGTGNTVRGNVVDGGVDMGWVGIGLDCAATTTLSGNQVSSFERGVKLFSSIHTTASVNTISNNNLGIELLESCYDSKVYNNRFVDNGVQAAVSPDCDKTVFDLPLPIGGNFWSDWTGPDGNSDGIVDVPYVFDVGQDNLPWTVRNGWVTYQMEQLVEDVIELNIQQAIQNSLDAKLEAALNALDDLNQNNDQAAINALQAFINAVEAQRGGKITEADADALIAAAMEIIEMLGRP